MSVKNMPHKVELYLTRIINFSLEKEELLPLIPPQLKPRLFNGRAMISMVDTRIKEISASHRPENPSNACRQIAFRVLIDDVSHAGDYKGVYFLNSFTNMPFDLIGGNILTQYPWFLADIFEENGRLTVNIDGKSLVYQLSDTHVIEKKPWLRQVLSHIDRSYGIDDNELSVMHCQTDNLPLEWVKCTHFETDIFKTARFEGAFLLHERVPFHSVIPQVLVA